MQTRIGFLGLGLMGGPMSANIARAEYPLTVFDVLASKTDALKELGAKVAASPREVAEGSDVVIAMLSDFAVVEQAVFGPDGIVHGAQPGMVFINMSTVAPEDTRGLWARLSDRGIRMLDAPMIGSTIHAKEGTAGIPVGGDEDLFESQRELLSTMGKDLYYMGPSGSGVQMKLCMNLLVAAQIASLSEAMVMAAKAGISKELAGRIIGESNLASNLVSRKIPNIVSGKYAPAFSLKLMQKDLGLIIRTGDSLGVALPATSVIHQLYTSAKTHGHGDEDSSSLYCLLEELAGLA
jgi:3-hydroxyisobutyrate dehydrogenase